MTLKLHGSSSGYTAIDATAAAGRNSLVLPTTNGSAGQVLTTDGNGNLTWTTPGGGKILQVVKGTTVTGHIYTQSTTFDNVSDGTPSVTITPSATSSKIFVTVSANLHNDDAGDTWYATLKRDIGGTLTDLGNATTGLAHGNNVTDLSYSNATMTVVDSPNTTSACKYQLYMRNNNDDSSAQYHVILGGGQHGGSTPIPSQVIAMEIGA